MSLEGRQMGHYHIIRLLGMGGMGEVYLAEDPRIAQQVAIKFLRAEVTLYPNSKSVKEAARLFEREARAIARLDHPNILPLYSYGEEAIDGILFSYLVTPYRKEGNLATWLRQRGASEPLAPQDVANLVQQAADALQHAHSQQVIHQDIKPSNFLVRVRADRPNSPDLMLADFGIARFTSATSNASQSIRGTPTYMAPEQWDGHPLPSSDQYALAVMTYELLTGQPLFQGTPMQVMRQHLETQPRPPSAVNPRLSSAIDAVMLRALAKSPESRFPSVAAFARAFQQAVQRGDDLHATLEISAADAITGTTCPLALPGGRRIMVVVPPGVQNGTILGLEGMGEPCYDGGPGSTVFLAITIRPEVPLPSPSPAFIAPTEANTQAPTVATTHAGAGPLTPIPLAATGAFSSATVPELDSPVNTPPWVASPLTPVPPAPAARPLNTTGQHAVISPSQSSAPLSNQKSRAPFSVRATALIAAALLLILGGGGVVYATLSNQSAAGIAAATAQARQAANTQNNATNTSLAQQDATLTSIAQNNATNQAQASAQATATAIARTNSQATTTALAQATATSLAQANAQSAAQATATAQASLQPTPTPAPVQPTPTPKPKSSYPHLNSSYSGTITYVTVNNQIYTGNLSLTNIQQSQGSFSGFCTVGNPFIGTGPFSGTIDRSGNLQFTVVDTKDSDTVHFTGQLVNGTLQGNWTDNSGSSPQAGTWSVS